VPARVLSAREFSAADKPKNSKKKMHRAAKRLIVIDRLYLFIAVTVTDLPSTARACACACLCPALRRFRRVKQSRSGDRPRFARRDDKKREEALIKGSSGVALAKREKFARPAFESA
jgi:hypothetical protein